MRQLVTADIFKMSKILSKMDISLEAGEDVSTQQLGANLIMDIGENLHLVEREVNAFMGSLLSITAKEFSELPLVEVMKYVEEFKDLEGVDSFLKLAGKQNKK